MKEFYFAQKAFIVKNDKILLIKKSADDPHQPNKWEVPGGRMEFGEDVDEHIKREVLEEVGISIKPLEPFYVWQWQVQKRPKDGKPINMQIVAVARLCEADNEVFSAEGQVIDDFIGDIKWVPIKDIKDYDFIQNMLPVVTEFLKKFS
ncbi:MAG: NUDIX domain-containing protein [Treponema sp.]|nr:NUDIX domain-containing protein [Treponema sp.]